MQPAHQPAQVEVIRRRLVVQQLQHIGGWDEHSCGGRVQLGRHDVATTSA